MNDDDYEREQHGQMQTAAIVAIIGGLVLLIGTAGFLHFVFQITGGLP